MCGLVTAARGFLILSVVASSSGLSAPLSGRMGREPSPFLVLGMWIPIQGSRTRHLKKITIAIASPYLFVAHRQNVYKILARTGKKRKDGFVPLSRDVRFRSVRGV